jgi:hypothetical protein
MQPAAELRHAFYRVRVMLFCGVGRMKIRIRYVLPAMLLLAGCANTNDSYSAKNAPPPVAPPHRVDEVSNAVGARMADMLAPHPGSGGVTR